jgi:hypothetical protein
VKRPLRAIWTLISSRALPPIVIGFFLVVYICIAFFSDETLTALMEVTRRSFFLAAVLALLPLNSICRIVKETGRSIARRRVLRGGPAFPELFDETVDLADSPAFAEVQGRLDTAGYTTRRTESSLAAWRGISLFPARIFFLAGTLCLFTGILISLVTRTSFRGAFIEMEPFSGPSGNGGVVERITLENSPGPILAKKLTMEVAPADRNEGRKTFGLYPPSLFGGTFVYPRYLGIALAIRFSAPDMAQGVEKSAVLGIYPPGKEATVEITGSPYQVVLSLAKPDDGSDPYVTGKMSFLFKVIKGKDVLFSGSAPGGGEFAKDGYRLSFPDSRRMVITDFIGDYGVYLIWASAVMFLVAGCVWLSVRGFSPRRELLFRRETSLIMASSRAEGRLRKHDGVFHEALDILEAKRSGRKSFRDASSEPV